MISEATLQRFQDPSLQNAVRAVNSPEVQDMIRRLGQYGLAVALPHMHVDGKMVALADDMCAYESKLQISFSKRGKAFDVPTVPVMWMCGKEIDSVAECVQECGVCC